MAKKETVKPGPGGIEEDEGPPVEEPPPNPDAAIMRGSPSDDAGDGEHGEPKKVKVTIGGREVEVDKETAKILKDQDDYYEAEIAKVRRSASETPIQREETKKVEEEDPLKDIGVTLFSDPEGTLRKVGEHYSKKTRDELTNQYTQDTQQRQFWSGFYSEFKELKNHDATVKQTLAENMDRLAPMKSPEAAKELAKLSRTKLLAIAKEFGGKGDKDDADSTLEGTAPTKAKAEPEPRGPQTLSGLIKSRRAARRGAAAAAQ